MSRGAFEQRPWRVSRAERRQADLFFSDLVGVRRFHAPRPEDRAVAARNPDLRSDADLDDRTQGFSPEDVAGRRSDLFFDDLVGKIPPRLRALPPTPPTELSEDEPEFWPEDLAGDMSGLEFVLVKDANVTMGGSSVAKAKGTVLIVVKWENAKPEVSVTIGGARAEVLKELIEPKKVAFTAKVTTAKASYDIAVPLYAANVAAHRASVLKAKAAGDTPKYFWLNRNLIMEAYLNRFDNLIAAWTGSYHALIGEPNRWKFLAPSWVKSMLVQESTAGTAGRFLAEVSPAEPWKTRFNVLQAIDSWGFQQFLMMNEIEPGLLKKEGMEKVIEHQQSLEKELDTLNAKASRTTAEKDRLKYLKRLKFIWPSAERGGSWDPYFRVYPDVEIKPGKLARKPAPSGTTGTTGRPGTGGGTVGTSGTATATSVRTYFDVVADFINTGTPKLKYDYKFWIRTAVRWMYEKRILRKSGWADMVRDYNGSGAGAELYRAIVLSRAHASSAKAGIKDEIWEGAQCGPKIKAADGIFQLCPFEQTANPCDARC